MRLISQSLKHRDDKEIVEKLFISNDTGKGHLKNIYQKLNVNSRKQAVEKAQNFGILNNAWNLRMCESECGILDSVIPMFLDNHVREA